ncbi:PREDICTED: uncharacterized protein LOC107100978 [Cyprinodon variegatus]|uniref:uncharacterized protein LOC107100978 n=1 Tax=Cyprinodon variegatus TaxID=28743 RepID=UPI0007425418|nr:PREDICTED: uncharacterized protein LOC107100978 [Cyprinodon variegatus]
MFCRETCEGSNLLVKTSSDSAQEGRYRTQYVKEASKTFSVLSVSITELTWSDSGRYRCGLDDSLSSASYLDFRLVIVDALLDGNADHHLYKEPGSSLTVACSFKGSDNKWQLIRRGAEGEDVLVQAGGAETGRYKVEYEAKKKSSVLLVTIKPLIQSDSGHYRCKIDRMIRPDLYIDFSITVTKAADPSTSTQTTSLNLSSSLGSFTSSVSSETSGLRREIQSASDNEPNHSFVLMLLSLTITVFLVSVALMVFCRISFKKVETGAITAAPTPCRGAEPPLFIQASNSP